MKVRKVILRNKVGPLDPVNTDVHDLVEVSPVEVSVEVSVEIPEENLPEPENTTAEKKPIPSAALRTPCAPKPTAVRFAAPKVAAYPTRTFTASYYQDDIPYY
jgi:hypothetical protein